MRIVVEFLPKSPQSPLNFFKCFPLKKYFPITSLPGFSLTSIKSDLETFLLSCSGEQDLRLDV